MSTLNTYRVYPDRNTTLIEAHPDRNTGLNEVAELWYGGTDSEKSPTGTTHIVMHFSIDDFSSLFNYAPSGLVSTYTLKMFDCSSAYRKEPLPGDTTIEIYAITGGTLFSEGLGHDFETFDSYKVHQYVSAQTFTKDGFACWDEAIAGESWNGGVDVITYQYSATTTPGPGDNISVDITDMMSAILSGGIEDRGILIKFTDSIQGSAATEVGYAKSLFTRHSHTMFKPYIEVKYDGIVKDGREMPNPDYLYLYTYYGGRPKDLSETPSQVVLYIDNFAPLTDVATVTDVEHLFEGVYRIQTPGIPTGSFYDVWDVNFTSSLSGSITGDTFTSAATVGDNWTTDIGWAASSHTQTLNSVSTTILAPSQLKKGDRTYVYINCRKYYQTVDYIATDLEYRIVHDSDGTVMIDWTDISFNKTHNWFYLDTSWLYENEYYRIETRQSSDSEVNSYDLMASHRFKVVE